MAQGSENACVTWTMVRDLANLVVYAGEWPAVGGIRGSRVSVSRSSGEDPGSFRSVQLIAVCPIVSIPSLSICLLLAGKPHIGCRSR
jgi:hypothetical protein